jgi:hypothetical protein
MSDSEAELAAMDACAKALTGLDRQAAGRVLAYLQDRFIDEPRREVERRVRERAGRTPVQ